MNNRRILRQASRRGRLSALLVAFVCSLVFSLDTVADPYRSYSKDFNKSHRATVSKNQRAQSRSMLSMSEAIAIAKRRNNGEVLAARRSIDSSGEVVYVIKVLTSKGVVRTVRIRAAR